MLARAALDATRPEGLALEYGLSKSGYLLSEAQAQAILELRLQRLTGLERDKIVADFAELLEKIADLMDIPVVMMGYGLDDDGLHSPNERFSIEMFARGIETAIVYLEELAELA